MFTQNGKKGGCKTGILTAQNSQKLKEKIALSMANVNLDNVNNDKKAIFFLEFLTVWDCQNSPFPPPLFCPFWVSGKIALCVTSLTHDDVNSDKKAIFFLEFLTVWGSQNSCFAPPLFSRFG